MNKLDKLYSFHISTIEKDAIRELKKHDINVSRFLRGEIRRLSEVLKSHDGSKVTN